MLKVMSKFDLINLISEKKWEYREITPLVLLSYLKLWIQFSISHKRAHHNIMLVMN